MSHSKAPDKAITATSLNTRLTSNAKPIAALVNRLFEESVRPVYERVPKNGSPQHATKVLILNLYRAYLLTPLSPWLLYSKDSAFYSKKHVGYRTLIRKVLPALTPRWVQTHDTAREDWASTPDGELERSRMKPTLALIELFEEYGISLSMITEQEPSELVICKAPAKRRRLATGKTIAVKCRTKTPNSKSVLETVESTTTLLTRVNRRISEHFIGYFVPDRYIYELNLLRATDPDSTTDRPIQKYAGSSIQRR